MIFKRENRKFAIIFLLFISFSYSFYEIGDTISLEDQQVQNEICYGEYQNDVYSIGDANHIINGGKKQITIMKLSASW